ncbi:lipopolysaccharide biosynthesis protein [Rossellomorea aquimaris]|uniref:Lipopolysaccharide biosynthesis protein n=1 Tax=Rossellomorea aquimaris TaxID=189382 RepID=A0A5D4U791_9BACI|nr:lipopolysaccharide biosynthesis protein [Rossellomorea aquimaris]TYS76410.1 lipopolysaccharide biosynthesis protein [Rossellomorea aquimaris]TYS83000.1 lipopolysaccharide biosynthesis protein [Rossellomorea aquimaris]
MLIFLKKLFSFSIGSFGAGIIAFISIPFLTRVLSPEEYGKGMLFISIAMVFSNISILGLDQSYARFYDKVNPRILLKRISLLSIVSIITISLIILINKNFINHYFKGEYQYAYLLIFFLFAQNIFRYILVVVRMEQKGYTFSLLYIGQRFTELAIIVMFISIFSAVHVYLIFSSILGFLIPSMFGVIYLFRLMDTQKNNLNMLESSVQNSSLLKFGLPLMASTVLITVILNVDKILLSIFITEFELGIYTSALQIALSLNIIQSAFNSFWVPYAYSVYQTEKYKEKFNLINKFLTVIMVTFAIVLINFKEAFSMLLGENFKESITLIPMLVLMPVFYTLSETVSIGINLYKKSYIHFRISLFILIFQVIILLLLIINFNSTGASIAVGTTFLFLYILRLYIGQNYVRFIKNFKMLLTVILTLYFYALFETFFDIMQLSILFVLFQFMLLIKLIRR